MPTRHPGATALLLAAIAAACSHSTPHSDILDAALVAPAPDRSDAPTSLWPDDVAAAAVRQNQSLEAARAALRASAAQVDGAGSSADPMATVRVAPLSTPALLGPSKVPFGAELMLAQPVSISGRLDAERDAATHDAERDALMLDAMALDIAMQARLLACDAWRAAHARTVHNTHIAALHALQGGTNDRIASGLASMDDALMLDEELAASESELLALDGEAEVAAARINALLHRAPEAPLPPPPEEPGMQLVAGPAEPPAVRALDRAVLAAQAREQVTSRAWIPDLTVEAGYSSMWPDLEHQLTVGVSVELPVQQARRRADLDASSATVDAVQSERTALLDQTRARAFAAERKVQQAHKLLDHQRARVLPAAERRRAQAEGALAASTGSVLDLLSARAKERRAALDVVDARAEVCRAESELLFARASPTPAPTPLDTPEEP